VRAGNAAHWLYVALVVGAYVALSAGVVLNLLPTWTLLAMLSLPAPRAADPLVGARRDGQQRAIAMIDLETAQLHAAFGYLLVVGWSSQLFSPAERVKLLALGIAAAYAAFGLTFRGPRARFWDRMTATGLILGGLALASDRDARRIRIGPGEVALGLATAAGLYGIFRVGDAVAREVLPRGGEEIGDIYALRSLRSKEELAVRLGLVIGPAEELFLARVRAGPRWLPDRDGALRRRAHRDRERDARGCGAVAGAYWGLLRAVGVPSARWS